jgi:hypothetical protein
MLPSCGTIPSWGYRGNSLPTVLYVLRKTIGPVRSGQQRPIDEVFLLEGVVWYGALQCVRSVVGERRRAQELWVIIVLCASPFLTFIFFLGMFCAFVPPYSCFQTLLSMWLRYQYRNAKIYLKEITIFFYTVAHAFTWTKVCKPCRYRSQQYAGVSKTMAKEHVS